ncbi:hypothetical protein KPSA3_07407 [Pseudomonas syringae pv. actinidiae]|uniref:Uncharacterized protein n=1 Tax=Pseudomonas syringae pv. actinidiae TaxID=103796 RepID=A0AAN4TPX0_PSESF|nr:hypothetical protein KPSA3_07407 [Pseudomonas syringae pv. actinidiae]
MLAAMSWSRASTRLRTKFRPRFRANWMRVTTRSCVNAKLSSPCAW